MLGELPLVMLTVAKSNVPVAGRPSELLGAMTSQPPSSAGLLLRQARPGLAACLHFFLVEQDAIQDRQRITHCKVSQAVSARQPPVSLILSVIVFCLCAVAA